MSPYRIVIGSWSELKSLAIPIREAVFVREQNVPAELELDAHDESAVHAVAVSDTGEALATARLLPGGKIGRMATTRPARGRGVGGAVLEALIAHAAAGGASEVVLSAQVTAQKFYQAHGFAAEGETYLEADMPHVKMRRKLYGQRLL
jgi:predicted GNAT family N-acyltransferase